ncbi:MAG: hypothetical protein O3A46_11890 [Candidatus Poribacteria bacterium]|nr:hypothetical protein [Candidatus Poribacteria bacterium]
MRLGIDLDNTIVCYDGLFARIALEEGLIDETITPTKLGVRDHLRRTGREADWTRLQGTVYGPRMKDAVPFPGVLSCFVQWRELGWDAQIISHRSRYPYEGPPHDLHEVAWGWLDAHGLLDPKRGGVSRDGIHLAETKREKMARIEETRREYFVDDLPEFLCDPEFPSGVKRVLFDPDGLSDASGESGEPLMRVRTWERLTDILSGLSQRSGGR